MKCPRCRSTVELIRAEDRTTVRYCSSPKCDWQDPDVVDRPPHKTSTAVARAEIDVNGATGAQR